MKMVHPASQYTENPPPPETGFLLCSTVRPLPEVWVKILAAIEGLKDSSQIPEFVPVPSPLRDLVGERRRLPQR